MFYHIHHHHSVKGRRTVRIWIAYETLIMPRAEILSRAIQVVGKFCSVTFSREEIGQEYDMYSCIFVLVKWVFDL